jgi:CelD/BcsL family acetyltransferase involved in cellulose biosynthesis
MHRPDDVLPIRRVPRTNGALTWELIPSREALRSPATLARWAELLQTPSGARHLHHFPDWFAQAEEHSSPENRVVLAVARDGKTICGLVPLYVGPGSIRFLASRWTFYHLPIVKLSVLGGLPLLSENRTLYDELFTALVRGFPECDGIDLGGIARGSFLWDYIHDSPRLRGLFLPHLVDEFRAYCMPLPSQFSDYLAALRRKKRYNRGREIRLLREHGGGRLELVRVDSPAAVPDFVENLAALAKSVGRRWPDGGETRETFCRSLAGAAHRGLLCSYLLWCGGEPVAGVFGYQHGDICWVESTHHSLSHARFSPGTVLLHLMIEELIQRGVSLIDFGIGNPAYGTSSELVVREEVAVILWRKTLANRVRRAVHGGFRFATRHLRRVAIRMGVWRGHPPHASADT